MLTAVATVIVLFATCSYSIYFHHNYFSQSKWDEINAAILCWAREGEWRTDSRQAHRLYSCVDEISNHSAVCRIHMNSTQYHWHVPKMKCKDPLVNLNATKFYEILNGDEVMFVGDSMTRHFYSSFHHVMNPEPQLPENNRCHFHSVVNFKTTSSTPQYSFESTVIENDWLTLVSGEMDESAPNMKAKNYDWVTSFSQSNVSLLVMNRGAHYQNDTEYLQQINETLAFVTSRFPRCSVVYRSTPPGHRDCHNYENAPPLNDYYLDDPNFRTIYNYDKFEAQNTVVRSFLQSRYPSVLYLDVFRPTSLRADAHMGGGDCLHYCAPGPVDTWTVLLYNALSLARSLGEPDAAGGRRK